jgi:hypothetical protein
MRTLTQPNQFISGVFKQDFEDTVISNITSTHSVNLLSTQSLFNLSTNLLDYKAFLKFYFNFNSSNLIYDGGSYSTTTPTLPTHTKPLTLFLLGGQEKINLGLLNSLYQQTVSYPQIFNHLEIEGLNQLPHTSPLN